ncbi:MAG: phosphoribosylformylglycinamidine synthase subunit PurS [Oligoflexia bacterium]|nr:phosphoribosylformylglycinamidine synthase subunit PurS [Oligoflexia bacterium]
MKYLVTIMPREEALDPQGRAVQSTLNRLGFKVQDCRVGKVVVVDLADGSNESQNLEAVKKMAQTVLSNPLIETFEVRTL